MSTRARLLLMLGLVLAVMGTSLVVALGQRETAREQATRSPEVAVAETGTETALRTGTMIFRHTGADQRNGTVASVDLADPGGPRRFVDLVCDRVDAVAGRASCLEGNAMAESRSQALDLDADWEVTGTTRLPGLPSRTRVSPDGAAVATTVFVSGDSYLSSGFSTRTTVRLDGAAPVGLESMELRSGGSTVRARDLNLWGVTFVDDQTFYVTAAWGGRTRLARGDLTAGTLDVVADDVECPSLSPDGTRIAFKQASDRDGTGWWTPAVLDLATGDRTVLTGEVRRVDDQIAWLDDDTVMYGVRRGDEPAVSDVWALETTADAEPSLLVEQAESPAVVR